MRQDVITKSIIIPALIVLFIYLIFISFYLKNTGFNFSYLVTAGDDFVSNDLSPKIYIRKNSPGYDGQFYYRLALNPFSKSISDSGIKLDNPIYRQQRIIYPLLAKFISLNNPQLVPIAMLVVNLLMIFVITFCGSKYAVIVNKSPYLGILFGLYSGFLLTLVRDLTEIVEIGFLTISILAWQRKRIILSTFTLTLMILSRETGLLLLIALYLNLGIRWLKQRDRIQWYLLIPFIIFIIWQAYLIHIWGSQWLIDYQHNIGLPLIGLKNFLSSIDLMHTHFTLIRITELIIIGVFVIVSIFSLFISNAPMFIKIALCLYMVFILCLSYFIWIEDWGYLRAFSEFYILGLIIILNIKDNFKYYLPILYSQVGLWIFLAIHILRM